MLLCQSGPQRSPPPIREVRSRQTLAIVSLINRYRILHLPGLSSKLHRYIHRVLAFIWTELYDRECWAQFSLEIHACLPVHSGNHPGILDMDST